MKYQIRHYKFLYMQNCVQLCTCWHRLSHSEPKQYIEADKICIILFCAYSSSSGTSERQSSQSPFDWMSSFDDDPPNNLNPEDVEQFLQMTGIFLTYDIIQVIGWKSLVLSGKQHAVHSSTKYAHYN